MKKAIFIILTAIFSVLLLASCSKRISTSTIISDIEPDIKEILSDDIEINNIKILEYDSNEKATKIKIKVSSSNETAEYTDYFLVEYCYNSENKLIFDSVEQIDEEKSEATPQKGVTNEIVTYTLKNQSIEINNERWSFSEEKIKDLSINKQDTNLKDKTDVIEAEMTIDSTIQQAKGKLKIEYIFDSSWIINNISVEEEFKISEKPECALNVNQDELLSELEKESVIICETTDSRQTISIKKSEITDFIIVEEKSENKGKNKAFKCKATLNKPHAKIALEFTIPYLYENEWNRQEINIESELISLEISGTWEGIYTGAPYSGKSTLKITQLTEEGDIEATYSYIPNTINKFSKSGSYKLTGTIDMTNLLIKLYSTEKSIINCDITAVINLENSEITGLGQQGYNFKVSKSN